MVSTRNTSRSNTNPPRMQDPPGDMSSRPPRTVEAMQANTNEVEALRLVNQRLVEELEQLDDNAVTEALTQVWKLGFVFWIVKPKQ